MSFLPDEYELPAGPSKYMKFEEGQNPFRILSKPIIGYEYWTEEKGKRTPNRVRTFDEVPEEFKGKDRANTKHFWAFVVYNRKAEQVQILEITQRTIMAGIKALVEDADWGSPLKYDIVVTRTKTGSREMDVEYSVMPRPHKALEEEVKEQSKEISINLEALYEGEDPFESSSTEDDLGKIFEEESGA